MNKEVSCGTIIIKDNKVLLIKSLKDEYGFPKGHMENEETEIETAIRETKEETNINVKIINNKRYVINYIVKNNVHKDVIYYLAKPIEPINLIAQKEEIKEIKWVNIDDVINMLPFENLKEMYIKVINDIRKV
jgi:bis(5'-nucleosidyl)-tetraphosphatase